MNTANKITFLRVILSPVFFIVFFLPKWTNIHPAPIIVLLVLIFAAIELSDLFDGKIARSLNQVSDFGKLLDPFSDSISRLTYFLCFTAAGYMPVWLFVPILYRDLAVGFIRQLMAVQGVSMPARKSGKIKAVVYAVTGIAGTLYYFAILLGAEQTLPFVLTALLYALFVLTALTAVWTLADYCAFMIGSHRSKPR